MSGQTAQNACLILATRCLQRDHGEFVTAEARHDIGIAECLLQGARGANNCEVAFLMPMRIIDLLQAVYVSEEEQKALIIPDGKT